MCSESEPNEELGQEPRARCRSVSLLLTDASRSSKVAQDQRTLQLAKYSFILLGRGSHEQVSEGRIRGSSVFSYVIRMRSASTKSGTLNTRTRALPFAPAAQTTRAAPSVPVLLIA